MFSITSFVVFLAINWLSRIVFLDTKTFVILIAVHILFCLVATVQLRTRIGGATRFPNMDEESFSGPSLPFQSSAAQTTTYTTAGTIYHPGPPQRLQAPARRGRLLKATIAEFDGLNSAISPHPTRYQQLPDALHRLFLSEDVVAQPEPIPDQQYISYEPLQQNYHRAVSPPAANAQDQDHTTTTPKMSWYVGAPPFVPLPNGKGKAIAADMGSSDDEDCILPNALMSMPVKSLQNLASYPNPNQKGAQKVLLQGMKPILNGGTLNDTLNSSTLNSSTLNSSTLNSSTLNSSTLNSSIFNSSTFNSSAFNGGTLDGGALNGTLNGGTLNGGTLSGPPRPDTPSLYRNEESPGAPVGRYLPPHMRARLQGSFSDPAVSRYPQSSWKSSRAAASETAATFASSSRYSTPSAHSDISDLYMQTSMMNLASGAGAPKPLTAGPPGLRQYRPSTFESTFKALTNTTPMDSQQQQQQQQQQQHGIAAYNNNQAEDDYHQDYIEQDEEFMPPFGWSSSKTVDAPPATRPNDDVFFCPRCLTFGDSPYCHPYAEGPEPDDVDDLQPPRLPRGLLDEEDSDDGIENEQASYYYDVDEHWTPMDSFPPHITDPWPNYDFPAFREPTAPMFPQCMGHPTCVTEAEVQERTRQLNIKWYAATGLLGEGYLCSQPIFEPTYPPAPKNIYGAVGDGRPSSKTRFASEEEGESSSAGGNMPSESSKNKKTYNELELLGVSLNRAAPGEWSEEEANASSFE